MRHEALLPRQPRPVAALVSERHSPLLLFGPGKDLESRLATLWRGFKGATSRITSISSSENARPGSSSSVSSSPMGYEKFSDFMGTWPVMNIYRRFGSLQAQNVLFLQAELSYLEDELREIRREERRESYGDPEKDEEAQDHAQCWRSLQKAGEDSMEYSKIMEMRAKLHEYNSALLQYHQLCNLQRPAGRDLDALRYWISRPEGGDFLFGIEANAWDEKQVKSTDLVTMCETHRERDMFSNFLRNKCVPWIHRLRTRWSRPRLLDPEMAGLTEYDDTKLYTAAHFLGTLLASMLPAMSIFVLYFVNDMIHRLCIILAFSALFSFTLAIFTKARAVEIFAATAAFGSVQVVFVGTTGGFPVPVSGGLT